MNSYFLIRLNSLKKLVLNTNFWVVISIDILLLFSALYIAFFLRYENFPNTQGTFDVYLPYFPFLLLIKLPIFYFFGLYKGMWRYTSTEDLVNIIKAVLLSFILSLTILFYINRLEGVSRSVFILDSIFTFLFITGHRVTIRMLLRGQNGNKVYLTQISERKVKKKILLIGAGDAAEKVLRELKSNPILPYDAVGMLDDNPDKIGKSIHGIPVFGKIEDVSKIRSNQEVDELLITIASASRSEMSSIVNKCQATGLPFKVVPGLGELIDGKVSIKAIRDISFKDLLGREEVLLQQDRIGKYLAGKTILITGAGGSIGSELCRQSLRFSPLKILLLDCSEENLFNIEIELNQLARVTQIVPILGRVQDGALLSHIFDSYLPDVVFHAAAYKHVPLIEKNPWQVFDNNILSSQIIMEASICYGVERFVLVSSDKAVRPTNVMGASKRLAELLMLSYCRSNWDGSFSELWTAASSKFTDINNHKTKLMAVRFGNVVGSSGSVIPLFKKQIENGGPVTVTHPDVTRFFMSIEEAAQLILQTGAMGNGGEIFILKMGEPVKIQNLARDLIRLAGREPETEIEINFIGLREGEKLHEELITAGEGIVNTDHDKIMVIKGSSQASAKELNNKIKDFMPFDYNDRDQVKYILSSLLPEYTYKYIEEIQVDQSVLESPDN